MKQKRTNPILPFALGVMALFLAGFLLLVVFGARSYRDVVDSQYDNMDDRGLTAYLAASVKANDSRGAVSVRDSEYGTVLVVTDRESGYALRFYRYEGQLVEDFARAEQPLAPEEAQAIAPTESFRASLSPEGFLELSTDAGRTLLSLRSGEEGEP
ncbi:MAG: DUF4860 domain-containing protein [Oscillospiraceae bacterium]|nr:DUF4860 domain-containing protein [Oscillospiraceae bacterium]